MIAKRILLDTNAYSRFISLGEWTGVIRRADQVLLPLMAIAELKAGFIRGSRRETNEKVLQTFCSQPQVKILCPDLATTGHYGHLQAELRGRSVQIPVNDLWIAALALQHGLWLCTSDMHFDHIPQLLRATS